MNMEFFMMISTSDGYVGLDNDNLNKFITFETKTWSAKSYGEGFDYTSKEIGLKNCDPEDFDRNNNTRTLFK